MNAEMNGCAFAAESEYVELAVEVFSMHADATRMRIILALRASGTAPVGSRAGMTHA